MDESKEVSELDRYIIERVKTLRKERKLSQTKLSIMMGLASGFIAKVETPSIPSKYNIKHLNLLAKAMKCNLWDIVPEKPL
jgi:transcriptional regulator with XRE-family HTH domain